ncbi:MAG: thioredoxin family protein [Actinomycetota bacterium]
MDVQLLYFDDCPSWRETAAHLEALANEFPDLTLLKVVVDTPDLAERYRFRGSPTVLVDGVDPFADDDEPVGLSCRIYQTPAGPAGSPTLDQVRTVLQNG